MKNKVFINLLSIFLFINIFLITTTAQAEVKKRIAVLNFTATNASESLAVGVRELTEVSLYQTELYDVLERSQIKQILREQDLQEKRCEDTSCSVEIGRLLSTDIVMIGGIVKLETYTITVKYVGIKNGKVILADSETAESESDIKKKIDVLINRSAKKSIEILAKDNMILKPGKKIIKKYPGAYYFLGFFPGAAQAYSEHYGKGVLFGTTFVLSAIGTYYSYDYYKEKRDKYKNATYYNTSDGMFNELYDDYKIAANLVIYSAGLCGVIYILNWLDVFFISKPDFDNQVSGINIGNKAVSLNINNIPGNNNSFKNLSLSLSYKF